MTKKNNNNNSPNLKLIINECAFFHLLKWISSEYSSSVCAVIRSKSFVDLIGNRIFHLIWNLNHSLNWCIMNCKHSDMSSSNSHQFIHKPLFRKFINWICFQKMEFMENCTHIVLVIAHEILLNAFVYMPSMNWSNDVKNRIYRHVMIEIGKYSKVIIDLFYISIVKTQTQRENVHNSNNSMKWNIKLLFGLFCELIVGWPIAWSPIKSMYAFQMVRQNFKFMKYYFMRRSIFQLVFFSQFRNGL